MRDVRAGSLYLAGRRVCNRHFHIISIFHGGYDLSSHAAISEGERGNLNQPGHRRTYGRLIRPAFTCWLRSTSWIKMLWCQQEGGTAALSRRPLRRASPPHKIKILLIIQGHTVQRMRRGDLPDSSEVAAKCRCFTQGACYGGFYVSEPGSVGQQT